MKRSFWQKPHPINETELAHHRKVSWLELFFDLFFVVAIAAIAHNLSVDLTLHGLKEFTLCFIPVWWIWIGMTYYTERFETFGLEIRLFTFLLMLPVAGMAIFAHHALADNYAGFVGSYIVARLIITILWVRAAYFIPSFRKIGTFFCTGYAITMAVMGISIMITGSMRFSLFIFALVADLLIPVFGSIATGHFKEESNLVSEKVSERFGLFTIIVLAEILVGTVNGITEVETLDTNLLIVGALGVLLGFCLWWIYFDFVNRPGHPRRPVHGYIWSYGHLPFYMSLIIIGSGLLYAIAHEGQAGAHFQHFVGGATGISLLMIVFLEYFSEPIKNEPTHPVISALLKVITGIGALIIGMLHIDMTVTAILVSLILLLSVNMIYGAYVWFTQELEELTHEDYRS